MKNPIHHLPLHPRIRSALCALTIAAMSVEVVQAIPYASCVTNNNGTIQFYLNESGGNVTVTYDNGSTNANFNGLSTGTNLASGPYSFALGAHTSYTISVFKSGAGAPSPIASHAITSPRGIDVNKNPASPYFGRVYASDGFAPGIYAYNPDMSLAIATIQTSGVPWMADGFSPMRLSVAADDSVMVGDAGWSATEGSIDQASTALAGSADGVWRLDPNLTTNQIFLGPAGYDPNNNYPINHSSIISKPLVIGNLATGPVTLFDVDSDFGNSGDNSLLGYTNITLASLPDTATNQPAYNGPAIELNYLDLYSIGNTWIGLGYSPIYNYIYTSCYRNNGSNPNIQIYSYTPDTLAQWAASAQANGPDYQGSVWDSQTANGVTPGTDVAPYDAWQKTVGGYSGGPIDLAVSQDGLYLATVNANGGIIICPLTNGLPNLGALYTYAPPIESGSLWARGIAFDAADNLYVSSSAAAVSASYTLGFTATAVTTGNASGPTGFTLVFPPANVTVAATTPIASQGGSDGVVGTPVPGVFTITRTGSTTLPLTVAFSLSGTATNGVYTCTPASVLAATNLGTVTIPANSSNATLTINPTTANVPRLTTTVVLTVLGGTNYSAVSPSSATVNIINTSTNLVVMSAGYPTMYKAFSNDYASVTLTRLGDTNVSYTIPASAFSYSGTAVSGTDFIPIPAVNVPLGAVTLNPFIQPLSNGVPPSDTLNALYAGNKSVTVAFSGATGYGASGSPTTLTLIDNAQPPGQVLFSDPLTDPNDAANWNITYGTGNEGYNPSDYNVDFGYSINGGSVDGNIGAPPGGATSVLKINCNTSDTTGSETFGGGVNVYYKNQAFSGNYAVRFNMNLTESGASPFTIGGPLIGINCDGFQTNWVLLNGSVSPGSGPWNADGVWYWISCAPGGYGGFSETEYEEYTGNGPVASNGGWINLGSTTASANQGVFKSSVFTAAGGLAGGVPANNSSVWPGGNNSFGVPTNTASSWSDVEIKQVNNVITLSIDKTVLFSYVNTNTATSLSQSGHLMLGYDSPIAGAQHNYVDGPDAAVYFANLTVIALSAPTITSISDSVGGGGNTVTIQFTMPASGYAPSSFVLQASNKPGGPYADVSSATITAVNGTTFQAVATVSGAAQFFRIRTNE